MDDDAIVSQVRSAFSCLAEYVDYYCYYYYYYYYYQGWVQSQHF